MRERSQPLQGVRRVPIGLNLPFMAALPAVKGQHVWTVRHLYADGLRPAVGACGNRHHLSVTTLRRTRAERPLAWRAVARALDGRSAGRWDGQLLSDLPEALCQFPEACMDFSLRAA